jgi:hypothetical protein
MSSRTFIVFGTDDGEIFLNLFQIVRAHRPSDELLVVHTSDGRTYNLRGKEALDKLFALLVEHSMTLDGDDVSYSPEREIPGPKITLIKPEHES